MELRNLISNYYFKVGLIYNLPIVILLIFNTASLVSLSVYFCLFLVLLKQEKPRVNNYLMTGCLLFCAYVVLSLFWGDINDYTLYKTTVLLSKFSILALVCNQIRGRDDIISFLASLLFLYPLIAVLSYNAISGVQEVDINSRVEVGAVNPIWLTRYLLEAFLISALILRGKVISSSILILSLPLVLLAGSKGALLSLIITLLVYYYLNKRRLFIRVVMLLFLLSIVGIFVFGFLSEPIQYYIVQRFFRIVPDGTSQGLLDHSRGVMWPYVISYMNSHESLYLTGLGFGNFGEVYGVYGERLYPHNIILEVLVELGVVGLLLFFLFVFKFLNLKNNNIPGAIGLYYFINAQFSGDFLLNERVFVFTLLSYMYVSNEKRSI